MANTYEAFSFSDATLTGKVMGDLTVDYCKKLSDGTAVSQIGMTLTELGVGDYQLMNPNITERTVCRLHLTSDSTKRAVIMFDTVDGDIAKNSTVALDATVAKAATVALDSTVAKDATVAKDSTVAKDATVAKDSTVAKDATVMKAASYTAPPTAQNNADAILDTVTEGTWTLRKILRIIMAAFGGKSSGGGTATDIYRDVGDTKPRITATVDTNGNRSAVTLDGD